MKLDSLRIPKGYRQIEIEAYTNGHELVICDQRQLAVSSEDEDHNCDALGCSTLNHVLARFKVDAPSAPEQPKPGT